MKVNLETNQPSDETDVRLSIHSALIVLTFALSTVLLLSVQFRDTDQSNAVTAIATFAISYRPSAQVSPAFEEGWLQVTIAETFPEDGSLPVSSTQYYLLGNDGHATELPREVMSQVSMLKPGSRVRIWGYQRASTGELRARGSALHVQLLEAPSQIESTGDHNVLYLLASFDGQEENPFSLADVAKLADEVSAEFALMSRARVRLISHKPTAWLRIPGSLNCNLFDMAHRVDAVAREAGIPIDQYRYRVYMLPNKPDCPFGGVATVGGNPARAWINDFRKNILVHEYGHAGFSRLHANLWTCPDTYDSTAPNCSAESSNPYSAMGNGSLQLLFSPQDMKDLGWTRMQVVNSQNMGRLFRIIASDLNLPVGGNESESLEIQFANLATRVYIDVRRNVEEPSVRNGVLAYLEGKPLAANPNSETHLTHLLPEDNPQDHRQRNYGLELGKSVVIGSNMITVVTTDARGATVYVNDHLDANPPSAIIESAVRTKKNVTISGTVEDNIIVSRVELWVTRRDKKGRVISLDKIKADNFTPRQQGDIPATQIFLPKKQSASIQLVAYDSLDNIGFSTDVSVGKWKATAFIR